MIIPCEFFFKVYLPSIKIKIAKLLYYKNDIKEKEIAKLMGITQAAVSKYLGNKFSEEIGELLKNKKLEVIAKELSKKLIKNKVVYVVHNKDVCELCKRC